MIPSITGVIVVLRRIMLRLICIVLFLSTVSAVGVEASGMSLLKGERVCVASGFEGQLLFEGKHLTGVKVVRKFKWKDDKRVSEETISDENGMFQFPSHWDKLRRILPSQFVVRQQMFVHHGNDPVQIWGGGKMTKGEYDEFKGKPYNLKCEITEKVRRVNLEAGFIGTNCRWERKE